MRLQASPGAASLMKIIRHADRITMNGRESTDRVERPVAGSELPIEFAPALVRLIEIDAPDGIKVTSEVEFNRGRRTIARTRPRNFGRWLPPWMAILPPSRSSFPLQPRQAGGLIDTRTIPFSQRTGITRAKAGASPLASPLHRAALNAPLIRETDQLMARSADVALPRSKSRGSRRRRCSHRLARKRLALNAIPAGAKTGMPAE